MKTFPLYFEDAEHKEIKEAAENKEKSMKEYIREAIKEKMERDKQ